MRQEVFDFLTNEKKSDVRLFLNKNKQRFFMINNPSYYDFSDLNCIKIYDCETLEEVGELTYRFTGSQYFYEAELDNILIKNETYKKANLENYALMFLEEITYKSNCLCLSANFYSEDSEQKNRMEKFFFKLSYTTNIAKDKLEIFKSMIDYDIAAVDKLIQLKANGYAYYTGLPKQIAEVKEDTL